jgi:membrane protease YdiL (CAAX protease family)
MSFLRTGRRFGALVRTVFPSDPSTWLLLLGATFLFISLNLRWWPWAGSTHFRPLLWVAYSYVMSLPILAAGTMGYYVGLVGCERPKRRLLDSILLPAAISLSAHLIVAFFWFRDTGEPARFVSQLHGDFHLWTPRVVWSLAVNLSTGFQFASIGFVLTTVFFVLLMWGRATLPFHLPAAALSNADTAEDEHRRTMFFVWLMIGTVFLTAVPGYAVDALGILAFPSLIRRGPSAINWLGQVSFALSLLVFVVLALGKVGRKMIPAMFRIPRVKYLAVAVLVPALVANLWPLISYVYARIHWGAHGWGKYATPSLDNYFGLPEVATIWYVVPALVEEIAWRGYLQPRFIRRYGLVRGIFLVGIVWGAFHFFWDFNSFMTSGSVVRHLIERPIGTVCMSYVLAWLTISSESILPATIAHAAYNSLITSRAMPTRTPWWPSILLWIAVGFVLLRFFPARSTDNFDESHVPSAPGAEPSEV